ncbi:receptor-like protein 12 [Papaver somniferum]|uniref:receptor-like protein 12 n=1 Tax=Papaver somniferum TaxID=3469 RepID=UPI000E703722|nr:receptor-like protein 12 [Papaver somniferum]
MTGTIPSCITKLRNLSFCDVSHNSFRGTVMLNELNLTSLDLSYNKLTVVIDQHQYPSPGFRLEFLRLRSCNLKGFIPAFICNFTLLKYLDLSYNNLTGAIPSCISKLQNLNHLDLSNNKLRGPLPLPPQAVDTFNLSHNKLNGEISMGAGERLSRASLVILNNNEISGSIPSSICSQKAGKLRTIDFSYNKLSGIIPSSIGYCNSLHNLNLGNNNLTGNIPNELPFQLGHLQLNNNNLNGVLPESTVGLLSLTVLNLGNNNFEGVLPRGLGSLNSLAFISLRSNNFTGSIPEDITQLNKLLILDLSMNNLSGPIPMKIGSWAKLTSMSTDNFIVESDVQFQLVIKGTSSQFDLLEGFISGIDLSCNILDGNIPEEIGLLQGLVMLNLSHNLFSGIIPASVGNMSGLESLDLSSNRLSGQIPQSLTYIDSLGVLNLSHNNLSGRIPRGNHFETLSLDGSAFAGNDLLCGFPTEKLCDDDNNISTGSTNPSSKADGKEKFLLYAIVAMGFTIGIWG